jgi:hypothetical protein
MNPRLGIILMFEGDQRRVTAAIKNVDTFTAVNDVLIRGDQDVTSTYMNTAASYVGNMIISGIIGDKATMPFGMYRYFCTGSYGGKNRTWYWDILVLPKDLSITAGVEYTREDYNPLVEEITLYEQDAFAKEIIVPGVTFTAATGVMTLNGVDVTSSYCGGTPTISNDTIITHDIGGAGNIPAGVYGYFLTGTYNDGETKATWYYKLTVLPKQGTL